MKLVGRRNIWLIFLMTWKSPREIFKNLKYNPKEYFGQEDNIFYRNLI